MLSRFQELKYEEIARLMGCEVNTVKVRVHRALQELRQIFQRLTDASAISSSGATQSSEEGSGV